MKDRQYEDMLSRIMSFGIDKGDRTGVGTRSIFGTRLEYDLAKGFPLITTKKVSFKSLAVELIWFLNGESNVQYLQENGVHIWDAWADSHGFLGPVYGVQWRAWPTPNGGHIDQISKVMDTLKTNPDSRRMIVSAWNVAELDSMALEPCHMMFQFYVANNKLSCQIYQRSCDTFLGVPFNIASYALLTHMFAQQADMEVGHLVWVGGDTHVYSNHFEQVQEQLSREVYDFPTLELTKAESIFDYSLDNMQIKNYHHHPAIKAPIAV